MRPEIQADLMTAAEQVNSAVTEQGMLKALKESVGADCKCLMLYCPGKPLKPLGEETANLTYPVSCCLPWRFWLDVP